MNKTITSSIVATTAMTAFSNITGKALHENFTEPQLLATLIKRLPVGISKKYSLLAGWQLHYLVGLAWADIFLKIAPPGTKQLFWKYISLGLISGVASVACWKAVFLLHSKPPKINYKLYYLQLIAAHIVFSMTTYTIACSSKHFQSD